jgi:glycosyltransferase involved in cell wall biosynthesis
LQTLFNVPINLGQSVAIVHFWCVRRGGAERFLDVMCDMFPQADIFLLLYDPAALSASLKLHKISASFLQKLPRRHRYHRALLPLFPVALEQFDLTSYDLVISSESGPAKGVITRSTSCHICYCHTPMRYLWDMYPEYRAMAPFGAIGRLYYSLAAHYVRQWDYASAARVDYFVANSKNSANRIRKFYGRESETIHPPVDVNSFSISNRIDDFYLIVSRLVRYKRIDLAIEACNLLNRRLVIIGDAEERSALRSIAGPTISFLGSQRDEVIQDYLARCRAFLFPGEEDFGIAPIEAQASGRPVIAYGRGGALETVIGADEISGPAPEFATGLFFREQTSASLADAILRFEKIEHRFSPSFIRNHASRFDVLHFRDAMYAFIAEKLSESFLKPRIERQAVAVGS